MTRRYLSVLLLLVVMLAVCCSGASAETAERTIQGDIWKITYENNGETARILKMTFTNANTNSSPQDFIIPSSVAGIPAPLAKKVTFQLAKGYSTPVQASSNVIKLEEGITGIADRGFAASDIMAYYLPTSLETIGENAFAYSKLGLFYLPGQSSNTMINRLPDGVRSIGAGAFTSTQIASLAIPEGVTEIAESTFSYCSVLYTVALPSTLKSIGASAFGGCTNLSVLYLPASVEEIDPTAFTGCTGLTLFCPPGSYAAGFAQENGIPFVVYERKGKASGGAVREGDWLYQTDSSGATVLGYYGTASEVTIPSSLGGKPVKALGAVFIARMGISDLSETQITGVTIPDTVETIGDYAFFRCNALKEIKLPSSLKSIGNYAFSGTNLSAVELPFNVTRIGKNAFTSAISHITLPANLTDIADNAFSYTEGMRMSVVYGTAGEAFAKSLGCTYTYLPYAPSAISITGPESVIYGKSAQLTFAVQPEDLDPARYEEPEFAFSVDDHSIAEVSESGVVYGRGPGTTTIYMKDKTDPFVNTSFEITVEDKRPSRSNAYLTVSYHGGTSATLTVGTTAGVGPFTFSCASRVFEGVQMENGKAERTITLYDLPTSREFSYSYTLTVTDANGSVSEATASLGLKKRSYQEGVGTPTMQVQQVNGTYQYTQSYPSYKTVSYYSPFSYSTYPREVSDSLYAREYLTLKPGEEGSPFQYESSQYSVENIVFFSSDPEVASVDEDGTVHALKEGTAVIDLYLINGSGGSAQTKVLVVNTPAESVSLSAAENREGLQQVNASVLPEGATGVVLCWSSSDLSVAEVDSNGLVTWITPGDVTITAEAAGLPVSASLDLHWDGISVQAIRLYLDPNCDRHLLWEITPANATNQEVSLATDNTAVVTLNDNSYFNFKKEGSANIRIMAQDGSGAYDILAVQGSPEHIHKGKPEGTIRPATAAGSGSCPEWTCLICGQVFQAAQEIPYNRCLVLPGKTTEIGQEAFAGLGEILQVTIPDGATVIGDRAFANCTKLLAAVIPDSVTQIGQDVFKGCPAVCLIVSPASAAEQYAKENDIIYRTVP